jgi:hypothetical protein
MEQQKYTEKESLHSRVLETMDKYIFLEEYLKQPDIITGNKIPKIIKIISTILYLRQRLGFLVEPNEDFYNHITRNDYTEFQNIKEDFEIFNLLVCFVSMGCGLVDDMVKDDESRDKIIKKLRQYYYKNKDYIATI